MTKVGIIGTGFIADLHMEALKRVAGAKVTACCDLSKLRSESYARRWDLPIAHSNLTRFFEQESLDVVHILVPPDKHASVAQLAIERGIAVFIEKPMAPSSAECDSLIVAAKAHGVNVGLNHNFLYYPLFLRLKKDLSSGLIGRPEYVIAFYGGPLGQLDFGKFSHWMFAQPGNVVLEQGPHPISQIVDILGDVQSVTGKASGRQELGKDQFFYDRWEGLFSCEHGSAFIHLSFGAKQSPQRMLCVYGQDGAILVDLLNGRYLKQPKSIFPDYLDPTAKAMRYLVPAFEGIKDLSDYAAAKIKLKDRSDPFFLTMKNSISAFYDAFQNEKELPCTDKNGFKVIRACEQWIASANLPSNPEPKASNACRCTASIDDEILVTGATGFLGKALVEKLITKGKRVRVLVRSLRGLPASLESPLVSTVVGDLTDSNAIHMAVAGVKTVFHLAHSIGATWDDFEQLNIKPAEILAQACLQQKVQKFIFASTIAAFYYADLPKTTEGLALVNASSPVDQKPLRRNHYARSKIIIEDKLKCMLSEGLPLIIVRPGVVVGRGGILAHSGVGQWSRDNVCAFWGQGLNKLPFVLVDDIADALVAILDHDGLVGKSLNLVGGVRLTAREYIAALNGFSGRRITSFPYPTSLCFAADIFKFAIKWIAGDRGGLLSYRDLANRAALADFDCRQEKGLLNWSPCADRETFLREAFGWSFPEGRE